MTLEEKQQDIIDEFAIFDDWMDKYEYIIEVDKMIKGTSASSIIFNKLQSKSTVKIELPSDVQTSGTPLSGKFKVKCINSLN